MGQSAAALKDVNESAFDAEVIERSRQVPVVVDFWAAWCGPCRVLGPIIEREVAALGGRVELVKVDTDANPNLAARYDIRGIPAVKAFVGGEVAREFVRTEHGRDPIDAREIAATIAKQSRPRTQTVARYDLTFSPVKSVSTLWAVATRTSPHRSNGRTRLPCRMC